MTHALESIERALGALHEGADGEVFIRRTKRLCVEQERGRMRMRRGVEEGTAVRLRRADGALRFGAASGAGPGAAAHAQTLARILPATPAPDGPAWGEEGSLLDLDGPSELPAPHDMETWLRAAAGSSRASLDAAAAVEVLGTGGGLRAVRVRGFLWARLWDGETVRSAVARRLDRLDPGDWDEPPAHEIASTQSAMAQLRASISVVLLPAAAGALVPALVAAVPPGAVAGPGWVCEDDPADPEAPGGGRFDDTGFSADRLVLADGKRVLAEPRGPGRRRRLSFREPPVERPAALRFVPRGNWDGLGLLVRAARVHADGRTWTTVLDGAPAWEGRRVGPWGPWLTRAGPEAWVAACTAHVGPTRRTPEGVTSGKLVFQVSAHPCG